MTRVHALIVLIAVLALAPTAGAATPQGGTWRGAAKDAPIVLTVKDGRIASAEFIAAPAPCGGQPVDQISQLFPTIKVAKNGRFSFSRHKYDRKVFFALKGRFTSATTAVGQLRLSDKRMGCDTGWRSFTASAGVPFALGGWSGTTEQGRAVALHVDRTSLMLGEFKARNGKPGFTAKIEAKCGDGTSGVEGESGTIAIGKDGSFSDRRELGGLVITVAGKLTGSEASGTVRIQMSGDGRPDCDSGPVAWTAKAG